MPFNRLTVTGVSKYFASNAHKRLSVHIKLITTYINTVNELAKIHHAKFHIKLGLNSNAQIKHLVSPIKSDAD